MAGTTRMPKELGLRKEITVILVAGAATIVIALILAAWQQPFFSILAIGVFALFLLLKSIASG
ncbi:MAG: hypothetical protein PHG23_01670 [Candidatus Pacebacteria bacterium]|nr:hypothetical protein [Candidatus Paceibacterota bacterium]